ncbi:iron-containing alcohol dehydrogenase [Solidesulfovibrio fructosivorans JJ]]|uniref:Iron-containing alcohol dehydrogenase n=1 Tax=Solidesulfovibrio fructosivorans JJ] TaxID=596151 RepID=E1JYL2_SOLFR|nr:iron-containing alcohol dehydrogenase [Solidesulfovibrio fructosivorans]EFL50596.1 iron-containing alcohol dehydrogenase [Solidesulfovibrio fructosivorans JJ]]
MTTTRLFCTTPRIQFGPRALEHVGREAARLGKTALIVTGRSSSTKNGSLERTRALLAAAGVAAVPFARVESDPSLDTVTEGAGLSKENNCDVLVALGGGSAMDAAKAISCLLANPGPLASLEGVTGLKQGPPVIAIPTTAGTGSEVTRVAVLTDTARKYKLLLVGETLMPAAAILDPELTASMPPKVAAATGMDALTHAIEAYVSKLATPLSDTLALAAIETIGANLAMAVAAPDNLHARAAMLYAQMQAGQAFSNASVGLVHAMSRPMGARYGVPHGAANAMLLPHVTAYNRPACPQRMARIAVALGRCIDGMDLGEASRQAAIALTELAAELPLPRTLGDVGVPTGDLADMAREAAENGSSRVNPRRPSPEEIASIYHELA